MSYVSYLKSFNVWYSDLTPYHDFNMVMFEIQVVVDRGTHGNKLPRSLFRRICKRNSFSQHRTFEMLRDLGFITSAGNYREASWPLVLSGISRDSAKTFEEWRALGTPVQKGQTSLARAIFDNSHEDDTPVFFNWQTMAVIMPDIRKHRSETA